MNALAIAVAATLALGTGAGFFAYQMMEPEDPASNACRTWPLQAQTGGAILRFEIINEGPAKVVTVCAINFDHEKVAIRNLTVPGYTTTNVDLLVPSDNYFAQLEDVRFMGRTTPHLRFCPDDAVIVRMRLVEFGGSASTGNCFHPTTQAKVDQKAVFPLADTEGPAGPAIGIGLSVAGLGALAIAFRGKLHFAALLMFTRLQRPKVLQLESRARIHELVNAEPGIHANAIADRLDLAQGETLYHLHVLVREKMLVRVGNWGLRSFFVAGRWGPAQMRAMAALRSAPLERLYRSVRERPGGSLASHAQAAHVSLGRASRLSRRLEEVGLVERQTQGRSLVLTPRPGYESLPLASSAS